MSEPHDIWFSVDDRKSSLFCTVGGLDRLRYSLRCGCRGRCVDIFGECGYETVERAGLVYVACGDAALFCGAYFHATFESEAHLAGHELRIVVKILVIVHVCRCCFGLYLPVRQFDNSFVGRLAFRNGRLHIYGIGCRPGFVAFADDNDVGRGFGAGRIFECTGIQTDCPDEVCITVVYDPIPQICTPIERCCRGNEYAQSAGFELPDAFGDEIVVNLET